jgi:beta-xylosidase
LLTAPGQPDKPLGAPDPSVISVDPRWCTANPPSGPTPAPPTSTSTTTSIAPTTTTTPGPPPTACYFAYSTPTITAAPTAVPVFRSTDLVHWVVAGPPDGDGDPSGIAFDGTAPGAVFPLWAPDVIQTGPTAFVMWFSEQLASAGQMCIWSASASSPDGPFTYANGPFCNAGQGGLIDPAAFVDSDGSIYLTYKGDGIGAPYVPTRIFESTLTGNALTIQAGTEHQLLEVLPAPSWEYPVIEGPTMMRAPNGTLFLFYSAYDWYTPDYKVGVARCDTPSGPCERIYSTPVLASRGDMVGPGGESPFRDANGNWQMAFHAWDPTDLQVLLIDGSRRSLRILPLTFPDGDPKVG